MFAGLANVIPAKLRNFFASLGAAPRWFTRDKKDAPPVDQRGQELTELLRRMSASPVELARIQEIENAFHALGVRGDVWSWDAHKTAADRLGISAAEFADYPPGLFHARVVERAADLRAYKSERPAGRWAALLRARGWGAFDIARGGRPQGAPVDGEKLRELRTELGMTQEALGEKCEGEKGMSTDTIQKGEQGGTWTDETYSRVAAALTAAIREHIEEQRRYELQPSTILSSLSLPLRPESLKRKPH
jgi:transcriptional regulator with XRE-family HTH domain